MPPSGMPGQGGRGPIRIVAPQPRIYATTFSATENPISEGGRWLHVQDRTDFRQTGGIAYGLQAGGGYDDSIMCVSGAWGDDTEIITTVSKGSPSGIVELEHIHRCNPVTGSYYEINFAHDGSYADFIRAEGGGITLGDYTYQVPSLTFFVPGGVNNGDRIRSRMVGDTLVAWIDHGSGAGWELIGSASDTSVSGHAKFSNGAPGIGAFITSGSGPMSSYAFDDFLAYDIKDIEGQVVFEGDSLTAGYNATTGLDGGVTPPPTSFAAANPNTIVNNVSTGGQSIHTHMIGQGASQVDIHFDAGAAHNVAVLWGGTNDIVNEGRTAAQAYTSVTTWVGDRQTAGFDIIVVVTMITRPGLSELARATFNAALVSGAGSVGFIVADVASLLVDRATNPALWQTDDIHITAAGGVVVAGVIEAAIRGAV
jgi:lysophospholipase L1-like esterase